MRSKNGSVWRYSHGCSAPRRKKREASIGVSVSAAKAEIRMAPARVTPNSRKSAPTTPLWKMMGRNTATSAAVVAMTARKISFVPSMAACRGAIPSSSFT